MDVTCKSSERGGPDLSGKGESNENLSTFTGEPGNKETSISLHSCGRRVNRKRIE